MAFNSKKITNFKLNRHHLYVPTVTAHPFAPLAMPPKRSKNSPSVQDPNRLSTRPRNAVTHPGNIVQSQCSTRRPESVIQAEKAEKAAKRAKKEQQKIKKGEAAKAIAEYEQDMDINDTVEDAKFPRHRDKAGITY